MLNPQEGGRLCHLSNSGGASAQHCTSMTNCPNTIQCLGSDDIMSLGIKFSAFPRIKNPFPGKHSLEQRTHRSGASKNMEALFSGEKNSLEQRAHKLGASRNMEGPFSGEKKTALSTPVSSKRLDAKRHYVI